MTHRSGRPAKPATEPSTQPCPRCGEPLSEGILLSSDGLFFMPHRQEGGRFGLRKTVRIGQARACARCGHVELCLNAHDLQVALGTG